MDALVPVPNSFSIQHARLGELAECWVDTQCPCGSAGSRPMQDLIEAHGPDIVIGDLVRRIRCRDCHGLVAIYLVDGPYREPTGGHSPYWSLALHRSAPGLARPRSG